MDQLKYNTKIKLNFVENCLNSYSYILLLPFDTKAINAKLYIAFKEKLKYRRGLVIQGEPAWEFLTLYSIYAFTDKLIIGSFDLPHGRKLYNLLKSGIATEDELINDVILGAM